MATDKTLDCRRCGSIPTPTSPTLLDLLLSQANGKGLRCIRCGNEATLSLGFAFALNTSDARCTVLDSFSPKKLESWNDTDGSKVTFYPFLVVVRRYNRGLATWMPYWHVIERGQRTNQKYGQFSPFMDFPLFSDLLSQARAKGYFMESISSWRTPHSRRRLMRSA